MPPKSHKKEEKKPLWAICDKCHYMVPQKKLETDKKCKDLGIKDDTFFTDRIYANVPKSIENIQSYYTERFILIPQGIASLCSLSMNVNTVIEINGINKYVRNAWIVNNDQEVDHVYSTSKELQKAQADQVKIAIKRFNGNVKIAQKIILKCNQNAQDINELTRLARAKIKNTTLHPENIIVIDFLNKEFVFTIEKIEARPDRDYVREIAQMSLDESFYHIEPKTIVKICTETKSKIVRAFVPTLDDIGGLDNIYHDLFTTMGNAFNQPEDKISSKTFRGVLLHGLSGCGKSLLAEKVSKSFLFCNILRVDSWKIFSKYYGESEENLRKIFDEAFHIYPHTCVIIIDEISNICPKNDSSDVVRKVSSLLISLIESVHQRVDGSKTFVIATTNNLDNVDPALRRCGRLDYEIEIPVPNTRMRKEILMKMLKEYKFPENVIENLAKVTHGYVGADLEKLVEKSKRIEHDAALLTVNDILENLSSVKPSAMRELLIEKPNVKWSDIGGMHDLKLKLQQIIEWPLQHPETFKRLGIKPPSGLLMFGAPGCSKTMIAKALATESSLNFISIKGSDLFSMWVGESEKAVRDLFVKARQLAPCIIFFDEIDAIGGERESGSSVKERVLAQILTEMDGVNALKNVIIIAATNRPDLIDTALMRPGRLDRIVYVKLPDLDARREIFKIKLQNIPVASDVDVETLVYKTEGYSGAEIEAICKEAALKALELSFDIKEIAMSCFMHALDIIKPRTSPELLKIYREYENRK
ncbi:ATPase family gene 2 protein homolog A [Chironomus tepperi]|uniref:ATPase family gene 2 protein homolog A n=1 Tax=Chironomus tepperi TaxID=113505 RepID=UPI00391F9B58